MQYLESIWGGRFSRGPEPLKQSNKATRENSLPSRIFRNLYFTGVPVFFQVQLSVSLCLWYKSVEILLLNCEPRKISSGIGPSANIETCPVCCHSPFGSK